MAFCQTAPETQQSPVVRELAEGETIHIVAPPPTLVEFPIKCDNGGDIFVAYTSNPYAPAGLPITKILLDSKGTTQFGVLPIDGYESPQRRYFGVDRSGTLYALLSARRANGSAKRSAQPDYFIDKFKEDGTRDSVTRLLPPPDAHVQPMLFGVFNDGSYLITGMNFGRGVAGPFTAIFDSSGRFVKAVRLPGDVPPSPTTQRPPKSPGADASRQPQNNASPLLSVLSGALVGAADGNVYLVRASNPIGIYGISLGGEVINRAQAPIPERGLSLIEAGASAAGLYLHFGHIANDVSSDGSAPRDMVALFDLNINRFIALYRLPANVSQDWVPACADNQGNFSFLGEGPDHLLEVITYVQH